jgi:hypothetical protein
MTLGGERPTRCLRRNDMNAVRGGFRERVARDSVLSFGAAPALRWPACWSVSAAAERFESCAPTAEFV